MTADLNSVRAQVEILRWCKARRAELKELEDQAKAVVQAAMGDDDTGQVDGAQAIVWKSHKRTSLDQGYLKKVHPQVHSECMTTSEVRRFEVCE